MFFVFYYSGCRFFFFFFSSRRRHTRCLSDWSSDVCSSDLRVQRSGASFWGCEPPAAKRRRSEERRVGKSVDLGGRRIIKKKKNKIQKIIISQRSPKTEKPNTHTKTKKQ